MIKKYLSGSSLFSDDPRDKDYVIITDEDLKWEDLKEKGVDNFIYYTHKENTLERIFFTIMVLLFHDKTTHPVYVKERPRLKEALENEFKTKRDRHLSKLAWWYLLAMRELEGDFTLLNIEQIKDLVKRNRNRNLTEQEKQKIINYVELLKK